MSMHTVVEELNKAFATAMSDPAARKKLEDMGGRAADAAPIGADGGRRRQEFEIADRHTVRVASIRHQREDDDH